MNTSSSCVPLPWLPHTFTAMIPLPVFLRVLPLSSTVARANQSRTDYSQTLTTTLTYWTHGISILNLSESLDCFSKDLCLTIGSLWSKLKNIVRSHSTIPASWLIELSSVLTNLKASHFFSFTRKRSIFGDFSISGIIQATMIKSNI